MGDRLYLRGGVWYCWGYDTKGVRWRASTKQHDRVAARIAAREIARERAHGSTDAAPVKLLAALLAVDAAATRADRSVVVHEIIEQKGRHLVAYFGPDFDIARVTRTQLERYADVRVAAVSRHTVAKELGLLRRARIVAGLPWTREMMPQLGNYYVPRDRWLPQAEYRALRAALSPDRRDYLAAFVYAGPRSSELYGLTTADVDLARGLVRLDGTKTDGAARWVPIAAPLRPVLERRLDGPLLFPEWANDDRDLKAACRRAGIAGVSPNDLRRTFCSWLAQAGVPLLACARLLGHSSIEMAQRVYARLGIDVHEAAIAALPDVHAGETDGTEIVDSADAVDDDQEPE